MKRAIILTIVLVGLTGVIAAEKQTDLQKENLFRKVKSVTETTYNVKESFGELILNGVAGSRINMYNSMGNLTEKSFTYYGRLYDNILYTYDEKGNKTKETNYFANGSIMYEILFDEKGNKIEYIQYLLDGSLQWKNLYVYDERDNLIEEAYYNPDGSLRFKYIYTYNDKNNKTEWAGYNSDGSIYKKKIYVYDDNDNLIEEAYYTPNGSPLSKYLYAYDDKGNKIEWSDYDADGLLEKKYIYSYEYDEYGNWVKETESKEVTKFGKTYPEPQTITFREITYY